jgi:hypothetical protein
MFRAVLWLNVVNSYGRVLVRSIKTIKTVAWQKSRQKLEVHNISIYTLTLVEIQISI